VPWGHNSQELHKPLVKPQRDRFVTFSFIRH